MDIVLTALGALWKVVAVGLLLGAGLPTLFSLGIRSLNTGRVLVTDGSARSRAGRAAAGGPVRWPASASAPWASSSASS